MLQLNPESKVHLYTTHTQASYDLNNVVNPDDTATRLSQFSLLHNFIYDTAKDDDAPIMVVGDLNVDAAIHGKDIPVTRPSKESSAEYTQMVQVINGQGVKQSNGVLFEHPWKLNDLVDVPYTKYQFHPVTFGDYKVDDKGELVPADIVLTNWDVLMTVQSIDRIFWSDRASHVAQLTDPTVEKFWVDENDEMSKEERDQTRFTQISGKSCIDFKIRHDIDLL